jgi:hypothetical protein
MPAVQWVVNYSLKPALHEARKMVFPNRYATVSILWLRGKQIGEQMRVIVLNMDSCE